MIFITGGHGGAPTGGRDPYNSPSRTCHERISDPPPIQCCSAAIGSILYVGTLNDRIKIANHFLTNATNAGESHTLTSACSGVTSRTEVARANVANCGAFAMLRLTLPGLTLARATGGEATVRNFSTAFCEQQIQAVSGCGVDHGGRCRLGEL